MSSSNDTTNCLINMNHDKNDHLKGNNFRREIVAETMIGKKTYTI